MIHVNTKERLKYLFSEGKINAWQLRLLWGYLGVSLDSEAQDKKAQRLINSLHEHKVIDDDMHFALLHRYSTYHMESNIEVISTKPVVRARFFDPFFYMPASFFYLTA